MEIQKNIQKGLLQGVGILLMLGLGGIAYSAFTTINTVNTGETLTAATFNDIINNQADLDARLSSIDPKQLPTAWIYFDGATCSATCTIFDSYGIDRVERVTTGKYNVFFSTPMIDINYAFIMGSTDISDHSTKTRWTTPLIRNTSYVQILTENTTGENLDQAQISFAIYGGN
ncbi:MAG: hypothetical protein QM490_01785 [Candidatus Gracilibacteria bacterium]